MCDVWDQSKPFPNSERDRRRLRQPITLRVVGLLAGSVLQGNLLIGEQNLLNLFPEIEGQQLFLIRLEGKGQQSRGGRHSLRIAAEDYGFDAVPTKTRLAEFLAVQNTYLSPSNPSAL